MPRRLTLVVILLLSVGWGLLALFHRADQRLPDGDELGHLEAIELYLRQMADQGIWATTRAAWEAPTDLPPTFDLGVALALHLAGGVGLFPEGVPWVLALLWGLTLIGVARLGVRAGGEEAGEIAALVWALSPLPMAMARFAMPEALVTLWVVVLALALREGALLRPRAALGIGALLGVGLLIKQTSALYGAPLVLLELWGTSTLPWRQRLAVVAALGAGALLPVGLWVGAAPQGQWAYLTSSAVSASAAPLWHHALYHPLVVVGSGLGLVWAVVGLAAWMSARGRAGAPRRPWTWGWAGGLLTLTLVPKKYPRLDLPLLPLVAVEVALRLRQAPRGVRRSLLAGGATLAGVQALALGPGLPLPSSGLWYPALVVELDPQCFQDWIRPAHPGDLGFEQVLEQLREAHGDLREPPPGESWLVMLDEPALPCTYQTTFNYAHHLRVWLRWRGLELPDIPVASASPEHAEEAFATGTPTLVVGTSPWECQGEGPGCRWRGAYTLVDRVDSTDPELPFSLYLYQRAGL